MLNPDPLMVTLPILAAKSYGMDLAERINHALAADMGSTDPSVLSITYNDTGQPRLSDIMTYSFRGNEGYSKRALSAFLQSFRTGSGA